MVDPKSAFITKNAFSGLVSHSISPEVASPQARTPLAPFGSPTNQPAVAEPVNAFSGVASGPLIFPEAGKTEAAAPSSAPQRQQPDEGWQPDSPRQHVASEWVNPAIPMAERLSNRIAIQDDGSAGDSAEPNVLRSATPARVPASTLRRTAEPSPPSEKASIFLQLEQHQETSALEKAQKEKESLASLQQLRQSRLEGVDVGIQQAVRPLEEVKEHLRRNQGGVLDLALQPILSSDRRFGSVVVAEDWKALVRSTFHWLAYGFASIVNNVHFVPPGRLPCCWLEQVSA